MSAMFPLLFELGASSTLAPTPFITPYSTYAEFLAYSHRRDVALIELRPREPKNPNVFSPFEWTSHSGSCYKTTYPVNTDEYWYAAAVIEEGSNLVVRGSIQAVIDQEGSWYHDITNRLLYVRTFQSVDPTDLFIQVSPLIAICSEVPQELKYVIVPYLLNLMHADVLFDPRLARGGLSEITYGFDSPYYGIAIPDLSSVRVINGKIKHSDTNGPMDKWISRFQWRDAPIFVRHGDGGAVLSYADHALMAKMRVTKVTLDDEYFSMEVSTNETNLNKMIPTAVYSTDALDNEADTKETFKAHLWGAWARVPCHRVSGTRFEICNHAVDSISTVYRNGEVITSGFTKLVTSPARIVFDSAQEEGTFVEVATQRIVDNDFYSTGTQYGGAFLRHFLWNQGRFGLARIPKTSFEAFDTAFPIQVKAYIGGDSQISVRDMIEIWNKSCFAWLRLDENNDYEIGRFDPANPSASVAHVHEDEIISIRKVTEGQQVFDNVKVSYNYNMNDDKWKYVESDHDYADIIYNATETLVVEPTILVLEADAENLRDQLLTFMGDDSEVVELTATGEVFKALPGDIITMTRPKGFSVTGTWTEAMFVVRKITKNATNGVVSCELMGPLPWTSVENPGGDPNDDGDNVEHYPNENTCGEQLLDNPSFETAFPGVPDEDDTWLHGSMERVASDTDGSATVLPHHGGWFLHCFSSSPSGTPWQPTDLGNGNYVVQRRDVTANATMIDNGRAYVKFDCHCQSIGPIGNNEYGQGSGKADRCRIQIEFEDEDNITISDIYTAEIESYGEWQHVQLTGRIPQLTRFVRVKLWGIQYNPNVAVLDWAYFDRCSLRVCEIV